ncbi:MAG: DEAD/DEAH box helicase family protein [Myxococcales bacterium]|nr:DEAD/DEAH box helicase family protein [Myxococcales bacterium]MCB9579002.1 DEAD/DEAH box helicase [Polyangiaceae bacterium]
MSPPEIRLRFDRGTLLLDGSAPAAEMEALPGVLWDPRVGAFRAPAHRHPELCAAIVARRLSLQDDVLAIDTLECQRPELRPYQKSALLSWHLAERRGVVVLPTGAGKTRVAIAALSDLGASALCIAPTRALMHQWHDEIAKVYAGPIGVLGDGHKSVLPITVATFESALRAMPRIGHRFGLLVVDEAHHAGGYLREEALEMCAAPARLGLTATPPDNSEVLCRLVGPTVEQLGVHDLAGRYLADFEIFVLRLSLDLDERRRYEADQEIFRDIFRQFRELMPAGSWADFTRVASRTQDGRDALAAWRRMRTLVAWTRGKSRAVRELLRDSWDCRVLVFTADNRTAYAIAREHLIMPITCDIKKRERESALTAFREGRLRALVSARVLNEGIDVPDADVAIIVGGTQGEREHVQRIGRLLRPRPGKRARVYELVTLSTAEARQSSERRKSLVAPFGFGL